MSPSVLSLLILMVVLGPQAFAAGDPHPMPLLDIEIPRSDLEILIRVTRDHRTDQMPAELVRSFPELQVIVQPTLGGAEGRFVAAFDRYPSIEPSSRPRIFLKSDFSPLVVAHEVLHLLIDRARLARWSTHTTDQQRSFLMWKSDQLQNFERRMEHVQGDEQIILRAQIAFNIVQMFLADEGEDHSGVMALPPKYAPDLMISLEDVVGLGGRPALHRSLSHDNCVRMLETNNRPDVASVLEHGPNYVVWPRIAITDGLTQVFLDETISTNDAALTELKRTALIYFESEYRAAAERAIAWITPQPKDPWVLILENRLKTMTDEERNRDIKFPDPY